VAGLCTVVLSGCSATPQVVQVVQVARPEPKPAECPPGAVKTMTEQLDIPLGTTSMGEFPVEGSAQPITVSESNPARLGFPLGKLRGGTVLSGRLYLGAERIYGRFTQARTPDGKTYPVCIQLMDHTVNDTRGAKRMDVGGPADSAVVWSTVEFEAVDYFK
jgi:serine/threonine-protein kinase